jgi:oxygen-independent coproporphyrinogen-3 oxidase
VDTLDLYLHIPFCQTKCAYCDFTVVVGRARRQGDYVAALIDEIRSWGRAVAPWGARTRTIYFGGGTPSLLDPDQVAALLEACRASFRVEEGAEVSLEANPGTLDLARLRALRGAGVNRLSVGVQVFDDDLLRTLTRLHSADDARRSIADARAAGFDNLSVDLIYGLPGQDAAGWRKTLDEAIALGTDHISAYGLTIEPATAFGKKLRNGELSPIDADLAADLYELTDDMLGAAGLRRYEIANFARPGRECRHNLTYWRNEPFLGLGTGAHSSTVVGRFGDHRQLNRYLDSVAGWDGPAFEAPFVPAAGGPIGWVEALDPATQRAETAILGLRLTDGLDLASFESRFGESALDRWAAEIDELMAIGLLDTVEDRLRLTPRGRLLGDEVFARFLLER